MTSPLARIGAWFIEPRPPAGAAPPGDVAPDGTDPSPRATEPATRFLPPNAAAARPSATAQPAARLAPRTAAGAAPLPCSDAPARITAAGAHGAAWAPAEHRGAGASPASASAEHRGTGASPASAAAEHRGTGPSPASASRVLGSAAVLGAPAVAVPVAAACAGELRAQAKAGAALLCLWRRPHDSAASEPAEPSAAPPAGATTPGARRLAARLGAHDLAATACGRLAWLALEREPAAAAGQFRRCVALCAVPVVLAIAGARPSEFEPLLADVDLAIAVLPADVEPALRELALTTLRAPERAVLAPLPPGPPRWAAMAGLARLRSLPRGGS